MKRGIGWIGVLVSLGLSAAFLLAIVGDAAATTITSPTGTVATSTIKAESEGHLTLHNDSADIECNSAFEGKIESHRGGEPASGNLSAFSLTSCTGGISVHVNLKGKLAINWTNGYNGKVSSSGMTFSITLFGGLVTCRYKTENTHLGTITGGTPATLHLELKLPFHGGSGTCAGEYTNVTGTYKLSSPGSLLIDESSAGTTITSSTGTIATPSLKAKSEGHLLIHNESADIECNSAFEGKVESHGAEKSAMGNLSALSFSGCTGGWAMHTNAKGSVEIDWTSGYNGTVFSSGMTMTGTLFGGLVVCRYKTENTHLGTITGGTPATLHLEADIPFHGGSGLCGGSTAKWTGSYEVTSPSALFVDKWSPPPAVITSPTGTGATPTIEAESEGHLTLDHPIASIQCRWGFAGTTASHLDDAVIPLTSLTTSSCTDSWHATTVSPGKVEVAPTGDYDATVTWSGGTVEMTRLGTTCRYKSEDTHLGTITGGAPATIDLEGTLPFHSGSPLCGEKAYPLTGSFKIAAPTSLYFDEVG